jgi:putative ABC transport system ATP-binding protein
LLYAKGVSASERRRRATEKLELVGLANRMHHHPNQLSGGQQQRVAIARALVNEPAILLGDEPTGNLDSRTSREVIALFRELNDKSGITIILVTHNQRIARDAKRTVVMRDGRIVCDTTDFRLAAEALREDLDEYAAEDSTDAVATSG